MNNWDVVIIGGGSAGLSAALTLVRARRRVLVVDGGHPRNGVSAHMHAVLGHDGKSPLRLLEEGRAEIEGYGGVILNTDVVRTADTEVETSDGQVHTTRRLIVATGLTDRLPIIDGLAERWGRGAAICPYCDGYEVRDGRIGIIATGPRSIAQAQLLRQWSADTVFLPHDTDSPSGDDLQAFEARGITVVDGHIARVTSSGVELADGRAVGLDAIFTMPTFIPNDEPLRQLGATRADTPMGSFVTVDATGQTSVPGVWAIGNVVDPSASVAVSIGAGSRAGGAVNHDLVLEDVQLAIDAMQLVTA